MPQPPQLLIDTTGNRAWVDGGAPHPFTRRWEADLLALLYQADGAPVSADQCNAALVARGQRQPLNRVQFQRLYDAIDAFLGAQPSLRAHIDNQPRQRSTGPWALAARRPILAVIDGQPHPPLAPRQTWPYPAITAANNRASLIDLCAALHGLVVSDGFAADGQWPDVLKTLDQLTQTPLWQRLAPEAQNLIDMRRVTVLRRTGSYDQADALLHTIAGRHAPADPAIAAHAHLLLQRIRYDRAPARSYLALWDDTAQPPGAPGAQDARSLPEWHNLRALLARRRVQALLRTGRRKPAALASDNPRALHRLALRHYQAAIYHWLWLGDMNRVQAYVLNLTLHLQTWGVLTQWAQGVSIDDVVHWMRLSMAYTDKLGVGHDTAWEYIFFAKFWLDNPIDLDTYSTEAPIAFERLGLQPNDQRFYTTAIERLRTIADPRQHAIVLALYQRFACEHMADSRKTQRRIRRNLRQLLATQPPEFARNLADEGYAPWLPAPRPPPKAKQAG